MVVGTIVGARYRIEAIVGVGGMGIVHRAVDLSAGRMVALKTLLETPKGVEFGRFAREAEVLAGIDHPQIVTYCGHDAHAEPVNESETPGG
jgi:serine/threonine protein kinase